MLLTIQDPNFKMEADRAIFEFCPSVTELDYVEHGADNIIALVNKEFVFRFPRNEDAAKRLAYETAILQKVGASLDIVNVPKLLKVHNRPLYTVASYIEGEHLSGKQIQSLTEIEQTAIGSAVAQFVDKLNRSISSLEVQRLRMQAGVDRLTDPWPAYFQRLFVQTRLPNEQLRPVVEHYYQLWQANLQQEQNTLTIHDDLNPNNLLFLGPKLNGVVDFSDVNVGSIESEFRKLYVMGDIVLRSAIETYASLTQIQANYEHIKTWAIMQELARFTDRLARQQTETFLFHFARENLRNWVPNFPL